MTKEQFLKRCGTIYEMNPDIDWHLLNRIVDATMRFEGNQTYSWVEFIESERNRTNNFSPNNTLANDRKLYSILQSTAVLCHPCQKCAEDPNAWHTRTSFCNHKS